MLSLKTKEMEEKKEDISISNVSRSLELRA